MPSSQSLYEILGVSRDASPDDLRTRYRELARKLHPDAAPGDAAAEERFKEVVHAYEVLSDSKRRRLYDEFGSVSLSPGFDPQAARQASRGFGFQSAPSMDGVEFGGVEDLLSQLFGSRGGFTPPPRRGADLEASIEIDFEMSIRGGSRSLTVKRPAPNGSMSEERLRLEIPAGIAPGAKLRLAGKGAPGPAGPGDLYVSVRVGSHRIFRRAGRDLAFDLPIHYHEAALGAEVAIPTLTGQATLRVPPGSQPGARLRLRGKGLPATRDRAAGDLLVTLKLQVPKELDAAERSALEALASSGDAHLRDALFE